jgi:putative hydrolase of the HAD superfamily
VRQRYLHLEPWHVYDDVFPTLQTLSTRGWRHVILSNHVPELEHLVQALHLHHHVTHIFNSAIIGYEKPHPALFAHVKATLGPTEQLWMIGDSFTADITGAILS